MIAEVETSKECSHVQPLDEGDQGRQKLGSRERGCGVRGKVAQRFP